MKFIFLPRGLDFYFEFGCFQSYTLVLWMHIFRKVYANDERKCLVEQQVKIEKIIKIKNQ